MLILTRKVGQNVLMYHGTIEVKVLDMDEERVTLGFIAPEDIDIDREEIYYKKRAQKLNILH